MVLARRALVLLVLGLVLLPAPPPVGGQVVAAPPAVVPARLVVGLRPGTGYDDGDRPVPRLATGHLLAPDGGPIEALGGGAYRLALAPSADPALATSRLLGHPAVRYAEPDYLLAASFERQLPYEAVPNDPGWPQQEEMRRIDALPAWWLTTGGPEVTIAVLDSGVLASHLDLAGKLLPGYDFLANRPGAVDDQGHGTFTAALAAGVGNNAAGIAGVCWGCRVLPLKVLDSRGLGPTSAFSRAIRHAVDAGARVINVSAGMTSYSALMRDAVDYAVRRDVLIVAAAGNEAAGYPIYPAAFERVLAVAASDRADRPAPFSSFGYFVDLVAPGVEVTSASLVGPGGTTRRTGTSASAPLVSGAAGLLLSLRPTLSAAQVTTLLLDTAVDLGPPGRDDWAGMGRLSVYDALLAAGPPTRGPGGPLAAIVDGATPFQVRLSASGFAPGEPLRVWTSLADEHLLVHRGLVADDQGRLEADLAFTCDVPLGDQTTTLVGDQTRAVAQVGLTLTQAPASQCFRRLPALPSAEGRLAFPETGHTLGGGFRRYWEANGGLATFGFPISEEFRERNPSDGQSYTVQYFERNRFEYHPDQRGTPYEVQLGLLGTLLTAGRQFPPAIPGAPNDERRYFAATDHTLSGPFLRHWEANGGLAIFGYPISEPFTEQGRLVQYFERNRFEWRPDLPPPYQITLGLLGVDLARRNGYVP